MMQQRPIRVAVVVASIDILGGQSIQALRLMEGLSREPEIEAGLLPINPRLPGPLRWLQRVKYVRTVVTSIAYIASLVVRLPRFDVVHIFSASYLSFLLAPGKMARNFWCHCAYVRDSSLQNLKINTTYCSPFT